MAFGSSKSGVAARKAGQYGREVVRRDVCRWLAALVFLITAQLLGLAVGLHGAVPAVAEVAVIALMLLVDRKVNANLGRRVRGARGEEKVGAILDGLAAGGWLAVHDASTGRGNIDHIAIGPGGVLTIETKSHRGRISAVQVDQRWLAQAYAERKSLEQLAGVRVDCLLVLSDAFLVGRPVSRQRGVLVLPARMLAGHLAKREQVLAPRQVREQYARVVSALDGV
jgi:Nuclease-related domain